MGPLAAVRLFLAVLVAVALGVGCTSHTIDEVAPTTTAPEPLLRHDPATAGRDDRVASTSPSTSTTRPALPEPEPLPLDPYAATPEVVLGRLVIPALDLDEPLHQGMTLTAIDRGPSQWPGTALPGELGNMVIAGHRTTYSRPFLDLDLVEPGDEMRVETGEGTFRYLAVSTEVVGDDALWIADQSREYTATTFACHPKGSARQRIVVHWRMVDDAGEPVTSLA